MEEKKRKILKATTVTLRALNTMFWKVRPPAGFLTIQVNEIAAYWIAELADKNITGIRWDSKNSEFIHDNRTHKRTNHTRSARQA